MSTALITGANGFVGSQMAEYLLEQEVQVRCVVRKTSDLTNLAGLKVEYHYADIAKQDSLTEALRGVDYVFHFAGKVKARDEAEYMKVNAFGVGAMAEACLKAPDLKMLVQCSTLAAVGPQQGPEPVSEDTKPNPISVYGRSKLKGEEILAKVASDKIPWCIVRPTGIYGPRDTEIFLYYKLINKGLRLTFAGKERKVSLIHARDFARLCWMAAVKSKPREIYMASDGSGYTWEELSQLIAVALGKKTLKIKVPIWLTGIAAEMAELGAAMNGKVPTLNREKVRELRAPGWVCSIKKAEEKLGFKPEYDAKRGIEETARWYRENGWL